MDEGLHVAIEAFAAELEDRHPEAFDANEFWGPFTESDPEDGPITGWERTTSNTQRVH
jgi:hypothetical protein